MAPFKAMQLHCRICWHGDIIAKLKPRLYRYLTPSLGCEAYFLSDALDSAEANRASNPTQCDTCDMLSPFNSDFVSMGLIKHH